MPPTKPETESPAPQMQTMLVQPVSTREWERDQRFRERAARRRDPEAHLDAQATLDAAPKVSVILQPTEEDRRYGESHLDAEGFEMFPEWECTYNGLRLKYPVGVQIEMPVYIWELYAHSMRLPQHRTLRSATQAVWSRDIPDGDVSPDFGR